LYPSAHGTAPVPPTRSASSGISSWWRRRPVRAGRITRHVVASGTVRELPVTPALHRHSVATPRILDVLYVA
jgi:hypothetical protein